MKFLKIFATALFVGFLIAPAAQAQKVYSVTSGEMIFGLSDVSFSDQFLSTYPGASVSTNMRWTVFFHLGQYWHLDFTNNLGLISGIGIRNVGLITDETLPESAVPAGQVYTGNYIDYKIIRRSYMAGIPLLVKLGSFKDHIYFYGGAEYELAFHYKEKYWTGTHSRDGAKTKTTDWFGSQVPTFIPSVKGGVQLPGGFHVEFKYYLNDFLDNSYKVSQNGNQFNVSDLTRYKTSQVYYISISWQFNSEYITKKDWQSESTVANL